MSTIRVPVAGTTRLMRVDSCNGWMQQHSWSLTAEGYAAARIGKRLQYAHRLILGNPPGQIDHADGDRLNNVTKNLRPATFSQQRYNARPKATYGGRPVSSRYKGVSKVKSRYRPFRMGIKLPSGEMVIRHFADELDAAREYDRLAMQHLGDWALTNEMLNLL